MSKASNFSIHHQRLSKEGNTNGGQRQTPHSDEHPPPESNTVGVGPTDEGEMSEPSMAKLPSVISNPPSQPSEHRLQGSIFNVLPDGVVAPKAEKVVVEPNPSDLMDTMKEVLDVLRNSTIASKGSKDDRSRFWAVYRRVAEEHDGEFLERYSSDMDIVLVFSGLFSAVSTSFIVAMEANLSPDPIDTTNALLTQLVQIGLGNFAAAGSIPSAPASTWSPSTGDIRIQSITYASLSMSLLAAFGAVLGKQWLGYYKSNRYGRGSPEERGKRRQEKFHGIVAWYFDAAVQSFPILLQISLLLFGIALSANMWSNQPTVAWVIIGTTVFGFMFYSLTTPVSTVLRMLHVDRVLRPIVKSAFRYLQQLTMLLHTVLQRLFRFLRSSWTQLSEALADHVLAVGSFARHYLQLLYCVLHDLVLSLHSLAPRSPKKVVDSESQLHLDVVAKNQCSLNLNLNLQYVPTSRLEAPSIKWLLETSTDPEVFLAAASFVPQVEWPLDLDVSDTLLQLHDIYTSCLDVQLHIIPSLEEKASACTMALSHLYCGRVLQAYPARSELFGQDGVDFQVIYQMLLKCTAEDSLLHKVLTTTTTLAVPKDCPFWWFSPQLGACPDSVPEWLSHFLPYHFVNGQVDEDVERMAITVISTLLSSPSSPSTQIIANCTFLACIMVGVRFDKKNVVRIDKSSALPQLAESLWAHVQKALWTWDGDALDTDNMGIARRTWNLLDVICQMLDLVCSILEHRRPYPPSPQTTRNLGMCMKIYSRARSSGQNDPWASTIALRKVLRFRFPVAHVSWEPAWLWQHHFRWEGSSHSPEDFNWLVDYLNDVHSDDHETAGDILLLLGSMRVSCTPAKKHLFIENLTSCMGNSMPPRLRHAALRAAHSSRKVLASINAIDELIDTVDELIDTIDDVDMVLTKVSPAIMAAVCPRLGETPDNNDDDDSDRPFNVDRDLCYLELIFALTKNSIWHPHLSRDHHIERCISMTGECRNSFLPEHAFYLTGILLRNTSEQLSVASLTEQQWWDVISMAWFPTSSIIEDDYFEILPILAEGTKQYMHIPSKPDLERLIRDLDDVLKRLQGRGSEQREGVAIAVKELRTMANDTVLQRFSQ